MKYKKTLVTPAMAQSWLENNHANRRIKVRVVESYARAMDMGRWGECPQPIVVNGGRLLDGQHRLVAIIRHGQPVSMWVCHGADESMRKYIDRGKVRTVNDVLRMEHGIKNPGKIASIARWFNILDTGLILRMTEDDVLEITRRNPDDFAWASSLPKVKYLTRAPFVGALTWLHWGFPEKVKTFSESVIEGVNLRRRSPELKLREFFLRSSGGGMDNAAKQLTRTLSAFNFYRHGREMTSLRAGVESYKDLCRAMGRQQEALGALQKFIDLEARERRTRP